MDLAARRGPGRMVFCAPDSFLGRGCGSGSLQGGAGVQGCPDTQPWGGVGLREAFTVVSEEDGWVGEGTWRAHPS